MNGYPHSFGILDDNYEMFFKKRCKRLSAELKKKIIPDQIDMEYTATSAADTVDIASDIEQNEGNRSRGRSAVFQAFSRIELRNWGENRPEFVSGPRKHSKFPAFHPLNGYK